MQTGGVCPLTRQADLGQRAGEAEAGMARAENLLAGDCMRSLRVVRRTPPRNDRGQSTDNAQAESAWHALERAHVHCRNLREC